MKYERSDKADTTSAIKITMRLPNNVLKTLANCTIIYGTNDKSIIPAVYLVFLSIVTPESVNVFTLTKL